MPHRVHCRYRAAVCIAMIGIVSNGLRAWPVPQSRLSFQLSSRQHNINSTGDIPEQRQALLSLYTATNGSGWVVPGEQTSFAVASGEPWSWDSRNSSYCMWPGVLCCGTAQDVLHFLGNLHPGSDPTVTCQESRDVLGLFLSEAGLQGMLPGDLVQLGGLRVLELDSNPGLVGTWPADLLLPQLVHLDVQDTSLIICQQTGSSSTLTQNSCQLPAWLLGNPANASNSPDSNGVVCPQLVTNISLGSQLSDAAGVTMIVRLLNADSSAHNHTVHYSPSFINGVGCTCAAVNKLVASSNSGTSTWRCEAAATSMHALAVERIVMGVVTVTVLILLLAVSLYLLGRAGYLHRARLYFTDHLRWRLLDAGTARAAAGDAGEMTMAAKRSRFPGTPSIALAKGRGVLAVSDVMVTWVATDVEGSTQLWEWDPVLMGAAVEQHNVVLRRLLEQHGGHEVRTDGDSFTLAFHDATDAVAYCIQAQEELLDVPWSKRLLEHPYCAPVRLGAVSAARNPEAAADVISKGGIPLDQQGPLVMSGLRVRMGIGTGVPDDIFVHDLTEHVEYRGAEYDLTEDLAGIAAGGQIIMGPKTFQRWNRVFSQAPMPDADFNVQHSDGSAPVEIKQESGQSGWQTGKIAGISPSMGHQQPHPSSRLQNDLGKASDSGRRESAEDHMLASCGSSDSHRVITGGDTLLVYNSASGTRRVELGRSSHKTAAAAGASELDGDTVAVPRQHNNSNAPAAPASNSKALKKQRLSLQFVEQHATTIDSSKSTFQTKVPLQRSATMGGIKFAISTAASAANRQSPAATGSPRTTKGPFSLQQSGASTGLPGVTAASLSVKGPGYGQMLTRHGFGKNNRAGTRHPTKEGDDFAQGSTESPPPGPVSGELEASLFAEEWHARSKPGAAEVVQPAGGPLSRPIAEGVEQSRPVSLPPRPPTQAAPIASAGTARSSLNIQGSALSMLSSIHTDSSGPSVTFGGQAGVMPAAGQRASVDQPDKHHAARRNSMVMLFRYLGSVAGAFIGDATNAGDRQTAPYLISTTGSSLSTQNALESKSAKTRSSIFGSMTTKWRSVGGSMNDTSMNDVKTRRSFETADVVLIDLGFYQWRYDPIAKADLSGAGGDADDMQLAAAAAAAAAEAAAAEVAQGSLLHLFQVQSQRLAPRMLLFDWPLPATEGDDAVLQQLLPGFLDAPGAASLTFQSMRELMEQGGASQPTKPEVAIAFVAPHNLKDLQALGPDTSRACQSLFTSVVREVLLAVGGYESKEVGGQVMAAFEGPRQAVEWALALQCALLQAPWPEQLAQLPSTSTVKISEVDTNSNNNMGAGECSAKAVSHAWPASDLHTKSLDRPQIFESDFYNPDNLFRGIRARVGIWSGPMDRVLPHGKSGRADYLGPPANRAARMMGAAQGGQVLVEQGMMQQVLAEWESIREQKANSALASAAAAKTAAEPVHHEVGSMSSTSQPVIDVTGPAAGSIRGKRWADLSSTFESPLASPRHLAHSPTSLLTSRRRTRMAGQDHGANEPGRSGSARRSIDAGSASVRRGAQRPGLFGNVVDSDSLVEPAIAALYPVKSMRWHETCPPAPWENRPDVADSVGAARILAAGSHRASLASSMQRQLSSTASMSSSYALAAGSVASSGSAWMQSPSMMRLEVPGGDGPTGATQVLTIAPAAYQPKGKGAGGGSGRSTRSTGSSTGSVIVSPASSVMKGRKSINVLVSARPSMDMVATGVPAGAFPVYDRPSQPAVIRPSMDVNGPMLSVPAATASSGDADVTAAQARRRSLNLGNTVVQTEDLYHAVEAALAGGLPAPNTAAWARRRSNLGHAPRLSRDIRVEHPVPDIMQDVKQAGEPMAATIFQSALYCTAVLRPTPPAQLPPAAPAGLATQQTGSTAPDLTELRAVSGSAVSGSTVGGCLLLAPDASEASVLTDESGSGDAHRVQLLPATAFSRTSSKPSKSQLEAAVSGSECPIKVSIATPAPAPATQPAMSDYQRQTSNNLLQVHECNVRSVPILKEVPCGSTLDRTTADTAQSMQGKISTPVSPLVSNVISSGGGMLKRKPVLSVVVADPAEDSPQHAAAQKQPGPELAAAGHARAQAAAQQAPARASDAGHTLGQSSRDNSNSGKRQKWPADNGIVQVADAVHRYLRQTGSNPGARAVGQLHPGSRSRDGRPSAHGSKAGQSQGGSTQPAVGSGGVWDAFTNTIKSAVGSRTPSRSDQGATAASALTAKDSLATEQFESSPDGSSPKRQRSAKDKASENPGVIAECFRITPAATSGDGAGGIESITMIKYTALKQTAAQEAPQECPFAPVLAAAAAAAGVYRNTGSTTGTSSTLGSSIRLHHWAQICVGVCVHKLGGFWLKGVDNIIDVVQVMPTSLAGRVHLLLPAASTKGKSRCVAPAFGLVAECTAFLPDLSQLMEWMSAPLLGQQQAESDEQQQQEQQLICLELPQQQQQEEVSYGQQQQAANQQAQPETDQQLHGASLEQAAKLGIVKTSAAFVRPEGGQEDGAMAGSSVKELPRLHKEELHGSESNPGFSIGAYNGDVAEQIAPSEAASTPLSVIMSSQTGTSPHTVDINRSVAGSNYQDHVSSISGGGGSANHLPNFIASGSWVPASRHQHSTGSVHVGGFDDLKGPAVLQKSNKLRGQAGDTDTVVASEAWSGGGGT